MKKLGFSNTNLDKLTLFGWLFLFGHVYLVHVNAEEQTLTNARVLRIQVVMQILCVSVPF